MQAEESAGAATRQRRTRRPPEPTPPPEKPAVQAAAKPVVPPEFDATEAGFHAWTDGSLLNMIQDCQVMRVGVMQDAAAFVDFMRTAYPYNSHWSEITTNEVSGAIRECARSAIRVVDEVVLPQDTATLSSASLGAFSKDEAVRAATALAAMKSSMENLLLRILLRPRRRNNPVDALLVADSVQKPSPDLASPAEALFYVRNVYLAQFNQRARLWAARDDDWARAAYLLRHPDKRFEAAAQMQEYDEERSEAELRVRKFTALTTTWAHEYRLWHSVHFDKDVGEPALAHVSPNLFLTDRSTPSNDEIGGVENFFKRMHWALPGHLPPEYGGTPNGRGTRANGHRLTLAHCLLGGAGFIPTVLASAAAGELPWAVHAPLSRARTIRGLRSVTLNEVEEKSEADVRLGLGYGKWLDLPDDYMAATAESRDRAPTARRLLPHILRGELANATDLFMNVDASTRAVEAHLQGETGEYGPPASDLNLNAFLRRLHPSKVLEDEKDEQARIRALLTNLLAIVTHVAALEVLPERIHAPERLRAKDREAIRAILISLLTNDMLKTILGRLADPAGASELASLDAYALSGGREAQLVSTAYFGFLAKSEERIPEWLRRGMREMRRAVASGNYGPIDDWMADDGGEPTHLPGIRTVTIAIDAVALMSRFGLYAHLLQQYHQDWRSATREAPATAPLGIFGLFKKFGKQAITMGRGEANAPTAEQVDNFFSETRMYDLDVIPSVYRALGHFVVGTAAYAHLFVLCGVHYDLGKHRDARRLEQHCVSAAIYGGIHPNRVLQLWGEGDKQARFLGASRYPAPGPGPAIEVIALLAATRGAWISIWKARPRSREVTAWLERLTPWIEDADAVAVAMRDDQLQRGGPFYSLFTTLLRRLSIHDHENALAFKHYVRRVLLSEGDA